MKIPILNLGEFSRLEQFIKVRQEYKELCCATDNKLEESLDLIQATLGYMQKIASWDEIEEAFEKHNKKLESRGWETEGYIEIQCHWR